MNSASCSATDRCVVPGRLANHVLVTAHHAREQYYSKSDPAIPDWDIVLGVFRFIEFQRMTPCLRLRSILTDTATVKLPEFATALSIDRDRISATEAAFTGNKEFSMNKLAAMVTYVATRGIRVSRAKLETIVYYSDMVSYVLYSSSISGSKYVRHRRLPGMENFGKRVDRLVSDGTIRIDDHETHDENIVASDLSKIGDLTMLEIVTIQWVLNQLGELSEREVIKYSENEHAHRFTRRDGFIAYEYGKLLKNLPESLN